MSTEIISFAFNEEFLLPFYFKHYDWVDKFNIIYDTESTDKTLDILKSNPKVNIIPFTFPDMMDDEIKVNKINEIYQTIKSDWVLNVDIDEFVFIDSEPVADVNFVKLFHVFRHVSDKDLDINFPIKEQRRHGFWEEIYKKPILVKSGLQLVWYPGNHTLRVWGNPTGEDKYIGAHWSNADPCFCVDRRVNNRSLRQSKRNLETGMTIQHHNITEQDVIKYCKLHENDEIVF